MKFSPAHLRRRCASPLLALSLSFAPTTVGQQQKPAAAAPTVKQSEVQPAQPTADALTITLPARPTSVVDKDAEGVTLDTLFAADAYAVYGEVRSVGQFVGSKDVIELLGPLRLTAGSPQELLDVLDFLTARADTLATARVAFGAVPARAKLPDAIIAVELASAEQAEKLMPELRDFAAAKLRTFAKPAAEATTQTTSATSSATPSTNRRGGRRRPRPAPNAKATKPAALPPFHLKRAGSVIAISDTPFTFRSLRQPGEQLLAEEPSFAAAHTRLGGQTLFVYFNIPRFTQAERRQREEVERQLAAKRGGPDDADRQGTNDAGGEIGEVKVALGPNVSIGANVDVSAGPPPNVDAAGSANQSEGPAALVVATGDDGSITSTSSDESPPAKLTPEEEAKLETERQSREFESLFASAIFGVGFGGGPGAGGGWPEAIGVGASLEDDALVLRGLFVNASDEGALRPIPFLPVVLSGPSLVAEAANVLPAETGILVSASLDLPQMYDRLASSLRILDLAASAATGQGGQFEPKLAAFEKENGFRIKEDLLNALGHELAVSVPAQWLGVPGMRRPQAGEKKPERPPQNSPVFLIALNDKKKLQEILPRVLAAVGLAGVSEQQLIEKRGGVELLTFSQGTVAFIEQFLVVAPDADTMRWLADSYNSRETLSGAPAFRNAVNWQPRQTLGQVYVSGEVLKLALEDPQQSAADIEDANIRQLFARLPADPGAITHAVVRDDNKLVHELRLPKNFLALLSAGLLVSEKLAPMRNNESQARWKLHSIASMQSAHKEATGRYVTLEELQTSDAKPDYLKDEKFEVEGYEIKLTVSGDKFEVTSTPTLYRKTGRLSFYIDQTSVIRGGDLGGKTASATDEPVN